MPPASSHASLSVGFVLMQDFTMLALAGFVDTLRLAADEGDRSRQIDCRWTLMSSDGDAVRASNGVRILPDSGLVDPSAFDYLVVVGGIMHRGPELSDELKTYLAAAAGRHIPLVGICTGGFVLARAGLMQGHKCCISWFHKSDLELEFPALEVVGDQLFVIDHGRITCAGGTSVIHLASHLIERHVGAGRSSKGLRVMLEERLRPASSPQPLPSIPDLAGVTDTRVRRAMLMIERNLMSPLPLGEIARAVGTSPRHLNRLFLAELKASPREFRGRMRMARAHDLVFESELPLTEIAFRLGFADAPHFARAFKRRFGLPPSQARRRAGDANPGRGEKVSAACGAASADVRPAAK